MCAFMLFLRLKKVRKAREAKSEPGAVVTCCFTGTREEETLRKQEKDSLLNSHAVFVSVRKQEGNMLW